MALQIAEFITDFEELFDEIAPNSITAETTFRDIDEWSSLIALMVIAMADENYDVKLGGDDIRLSTTVADLHEKIRSKQD